MLVVGVVTGIVTLINYFLSDYKTDAFGNVSIYETLPSELVRLQRADSLIAAQKTLFDLGLVISEDSLLNLVGNNISDENGSKKIIKMKFDVDLRFNTELRKDMSLWTFDIINNGNKILNNLCLKLPFKGRAKITNSEGVIIYSDFDHTIALGAIQPSLKIQILCWTEEYYEVSKFLLERCRVVHDNGSEEIIFKSNNWKISQWNDRNYDLPLLFLILFVFISSVNFYYYIINHYYKKGQVYVHENLRSYKTTIEEKEQEIVQLKEQIMNKKWGV